MVMYLKLKWQEVKNNHYPLIEKVASTGKPLIISTGMATLDELKEVYNIVKNSRSKNLIFLNEHIQEIECYYLKLIKSYLRCCL